MKRRRWKPEQKALIVTRTSSSGRSGPSPWGARMPCLPAPMAEPAIGRPVASLVATAKLNGVEPMAWLTHVLERVVSGRAKAHELERLLPWAWEAERLAAAANA
jgi:IS66 C-terminal element